MTQLVDPYGLYGWKGPFSIPIRSENCISLRGLRMEFKSCQSQGGERSCRSVRFVQMERAVFHPYAVGKSHLIKGTWNINHVF